MKIKSRKAEPKLEMLDTQTVELTLDIHPVTNRHTITAKVVIEVPWPVVLDHDEFHHFIQDVKTGIKVARPRRDNEEV